MPSFDGSVLEPATLTYEMNMARPSDTSKSVIALTLSKASHDGQPAWRLVNGPPGAGDGSKSVLHLDRSSLLPLTLKIPGTFDLTYDGTTVTGSTGAGQNTTAIDTTLGHRVLDEKSSNLNVALASLPLEVGQTFAVPTFSPLEPAVHVATGEVTGTETVTVPAGSFETYVVSMTSSAEAPSTSGTFHLRATAPHYLVKGTVTLETGGSYSMTVTRELEKLEEK